MLTFLATRSVRDSEDKDERAGVLVLKPADLAPPLPKPGTAKPEPEPYVPPSPEEQAAHEAMVREREHELHANRRMSGFYESRTPNIVMGRRNR
jgi:hypothetical protein